MFQIVENNRHSSLKFAAMAEAGEDLEFRGSG
jgi:hypothetical protein